MAAGLWRFAWTTYLTLLGAAPVFAQRQTALPPIETVDYDQRGAFRVNGKPFFPIALYDAPLDDRTLRELRDFGFNVLASDAKSCAALPAKGFYGAAHADNKIDNMTGVLLGLGADSPALIFKKDLLKQVAEANAKTRAAVPGRPIMNAIGYWENEPAGVVKGKLPSKAVYEDLVVAIDVSAPYLYPVPYQPISSVGDAVARARRASAGKKPVLPALQIFVWEAKDRYPTPAELRSMAFLALVEGAHGIGYYSYGSVTGRPKTTIAAAQPELWKSVKKLNHDIANIGPRLLSGTEANDLTLGKGTPAVKMKLVREKGGLLAVVVNSAATRQQVKLTAQAGTFGRLVLQNGKQIEVKEGVATLPLEPFGVEIVCLPR
jgi:hypothetical protein